MKRARNGVCLFLAIVLCIASACWATEDRPFDEGQSGDGFLKYINGVPVLCVSGTPEEMGRQEAALIGKVVVKLSHYPAAMVNRSSNEDRTPKYLKMSKTIYAHLLPEHRGELQVFVDQSGAERNLLMLGNTLADVYRNISCSSLIVEPGKSATGGPIFGRNLDFYTLKILDRYSLVTVQKPKGKHAFASIGFPGLFGCLSGMNDAGLALSVHEAFMAGDRAPIFNPKGMPYTFCFREILERCTTVEEAEQMLRKTERTTILSLAVCDRRKAVVLELTPKTVAARYASDGILACTNNFHTEQLAVMPWLPICNRYPKLIEACKLDKLDVAAVAKKMHEVNMGMMTVQTMIFEPAAGRLHVAFGSCPSSALPMKTLELGPLFAGDAKSASTFDQNTTEKAATRRQDVLRAITYNTQFLPGIAERFNKRGDASYRAKAIGKAVAQFDIIGLNEVFDLQHRKELLSEVRNAWGDGNCHSVTAPDNQRSVVGVDGGLAIVTRLPLVESHSVSFGNGSSVLKYGIDADGLADKGILHARLAVSDNKQLDVFVTHLESTDSSIRERQYEILGQTIQRYAARHLPVLLMGDLNTVGGKSDRECPTFGYSKLLKSLNSARPNAPFVDLWPQLHSEDGPTNSPERLSGGARIDYIFVSQGPDTVPPLKPTSVNVERFLDNRTKTLSDHAAVTAALAY